MKRRFKDPDRMTPEEVVAEIASIQGEVKMLGKRLHELAHGLHRRTRRSPVDESTSAYLTFSGVNVRLAGALEQVIRRSERVSKVLEKSIAEPEPERPPQRVPAKSSAARTLSPVESLINLYSSEPASGLPTGDS